MTISTVRRIEFTILVDHDCAAFDGPCRRVIAGSLPLIVELGHVRSSDGSSSHHLAIAVIS